MKRVVDRVANNSAKKALTAHGRDTAKILALIFSVLIVLGTAQRAFAQAAASEYQVKAAFLFHFAQLVDWPGEAFKIETNSLSLCVFEDETQLREIQSIVEGKLVGSRVLHIRLLHPAQDAGGCNILFLSRDQAHRQAAILKSLRGLPILTVGETYDFLSDGGMIRFHLEGDRIRFDISLEAAESAHLRISSRLMLLASNGVPGNPKKPGGK